MNVLPRAAAAHDPREFFHDGKEFYFYEFKSSTSNIEAVQNERFCGFKGTITLAHWQPHHSIRPSVYNGREWCLNYTS